MNIIGNFKLDGERYTGSINILKFSGAAVIEPATPKNSEDAPDFRVFGGRSRVEIGAAWKERSDRGTSYLSIRLDEPSFTAPVFCRLVQFEGEEGYRLIWSRS
jgi:uncharacterized protein (DUF736 family)